MMFLRLIGADIADAGPCAVANRNRPPAKAAEAAMVALITISLDGGRGIIHRHNPACNRNP